jgi:SAM-dependent methyltransferase/predicted O-methyltransferase YrrM
MRFQKQPILAELMPFVHPEDANADYMLSGNCYEWYAGYAAALKPKSILEIGTRRGYSLLAMLLSCDTVEEIAVLDNESYGVKLDWIEEILTAIRADGINGQKPGFRVYRNDTQTDGIQLPLRYHGTDHASERWDIIHVDGDHTEAGALHDLELAAEALAPSGTIILDDVVFYADVAKALRRFEADHPGEWLVDHYPSLRGHALLTRREEVEPQRHEGTKEEVKAVEATSPPLVPSCLSGPKQPTQLDKVRASMFRPGSFSSAQGAVVGHCNGHSTSQRWEIETPRFAERIVEVFQRLAPAPTGMTPRDVYGDGQILETPPLRLPRLLDFGVGCGRLAKEVMSRMDCKLIGFDTSPDQLTIAKGYVTQTHFYTTDSIGALPVGGIDLAYSVYVLQHIPAIELRDSIRAIHSALKPDGLFIYCGSDYRLAVTEKGFFDDRFCGVNVREEIERLFDEVGDLFPDIQSEHPLIRDIITAEGCPPGSIAHPAKIYRKR